MSHCISILNYLHILSIDLTVRQSKYYCISGREGCALYDSQALQDTTGREMIVGMWTVPHLAVYSSITHTLCHKSVSTPSVPSSTCPATAHNPPRPPARWTDNHILVMRLSLDPPGKFNFFCFSVKENLRGASSIMFL